MRLQRLVVSCHDFVAGCHDSVARCHDSVARLHDSVARLVAGETPPISEDDVTPRPRSRLTRPLLVIIAALSVPVLLAVPGAIAATHGRLTSHHASGSSHGAQKSSCAPGLLFCENFNALPLGAATSKKWGVDTQQGTLTVVPAHRHSTNLVMRAHTVGNGRALLVINDFHAPKNTFYGRMWVKVKAFPTAPGFAHFILVQATGTGSKEMVRPVGGQFVEKKFLKNGGPARSLWGIGTDGGATGDWTNWKESATAVPGVWQCIRWSVQGANNRVQLLVNGVVNPDLVVSTNNHGGKQVPFELPKFNKIQIGWWLFQPGSKPLAYDLLYDNIALSSQHLGCGPAPSSR